MSQGGEIIDDKQICEKTKGAPTNTTSVGNSLLQGFRLPDSDWNERLLLLLPPQTFPLLKARMRILVFERVFEKLKSCRKWKNRVHIRPLAVRLGETPGEIQERHKARKDGTNPVKREALPATRRAAASGERHGKEGQTNRRS